MLQLSIRRTLTRTGEWTAHPSAFLVVIAFTATWLVFERETFDWHGAATIATWLMTLLIQRSEFRDSEAIQAKLDELLRVTNGAREHLAGLDEAEPEEVVRHREANRDS